MNREVGLGSHSLLSLLVSVDVKHRVRKEERKKTAAARPYLVESQLFT